MMEKSVRVFSVGFLLLIVAVAAFVYFLGQTFLNSPASSQKREVIYEIAPNTSFAKISKDLLEKGVIKNADFFNLYAKFTRQRGKIKVGEYGLHTAMRPSEVLDVITSGKSIARPFRVIEGLNIFEVAEEYERQGFGTKKEFLRWATDKSFIQSLLKQPLNSLEGYLFPETYQVTKFTDVQELIGAMVRRFQIVFAEVLKESLVTNLNPNQILILASIIEKESGSPEERGFVSSVFHNRLAKKMKLQTDPTVLYGKLMTTGQLSMNITKEDLGKATPYNTYVIDGLPPGPISNPGRESLMAAVKPPSTKYLFFVSQNNGTSIFSENYEDHHKAVLKFQMNAKARQGKSWRDLKKSIENPLNPPGAKVTPNVSPTGNPAAKSAPQTPTAAPQKTTPATTPKK